MPFYTVIPNKIVEDTSISSTAKLCYGMLINHEGTMTPPHVILAKEIGTSISHLQRVLKELEHAKYIKKIKYEEKGSEFDGSTLYQVLIK